MRRNLFWVTFRHYLRRLSKDPISPLIYIGLPVVLVYILGFVYTQNTNEQIYVDGYNMVSTSISAGMMLLFQISGGDYLLNYLNHDLIKPMRWRLKATPCRTHTLVFSGAAACMILTVLQGLLVVACTAFLLDAYWGSLWVTVSVIVLISIISQLLNMILLLYVRKANTANNISWAISWGMAVLGGMMFTLPDNAFFNFMRQYGTPFSLAQSAIRQSGFLGTSPADVPICLAALAGIAIIMMVVVIALGRRKLA